MEIFMFFVWIHHHLPDFNISGKRLAFNQIIGKLTILISLEHDNYLATKKVFYPESLYNIEPAELTSRASI